MTIQLEFLKTACYFRRLEPACLEDIIKYVFEKRVPTGEVVLWEGDEEENLYFVIAGLLKLFATSADGREFVVRLAYGGDSANDEGIFDKGPNVLSAMTMSPVLLYGLHCDDLDKIRRAHPPVNEAVAQVFAARQRYLVRLTTELVFKNVTGRLARLLLEREKLLNGENRDLRITQQEMAAMIGTVREIVSRSLREMEAKGAVMVDHNQIIVKDKKLLLELSSL
ncbi:MAG: Crp/Fnr family transcriptional regulator [Chloroflexi bacterium]|nr:Crp/Fnr family transcriptional regulator [Chloroflexota bacterium]